MPDILNDEPGTFEGGLDPNIHAQVREALLALNQNAFAGRGAPGLTVRSVIEDGAVANGPDCLAAFQATVDTVAAAGGGIALVPAGLPFHWTGTLTIPNNVILRGLGDRTLLIVHAIPEPQEPGPAIRFAPGKHLGGVEDLILYGDLGDLDRRPTIGIDLSGAQFLRLHNFMVWDFPVGVCLSDGVTQFAGCNHVSDFEINSCHVGIRASTHCNQASVLKGRIHYCRNKGAGIALDIAPVEPWNPQEPPPLAAEALTIAHVAIEDFDLGVRIRGRAHVSLRDVYYEADPVPNLNGPGVWMDIRPEKGSVVRMENSIANVSRSLVMSGSLEDAITNDERASFAFGAKRHHAAAPERNLIENGDFHRAHGTATIPGWVPNFSPVLAESNDFVTATRSYDIAQAGNGNDGLRTTFTVPETTDYVTVMVRYKNISSSALLFTAISGSKTAQFGDPLPPSGTQWRVAAFTVEVDPSAAGVVTLILTADQVVKGGRIRVDEAWAVVGATAAPPRAHGHRIEMLTTPVRVASRNALAANAEFPATQLTGLPGLGGAPRGIIGAILSLRGTATLQPQNPGNTGAPLPRVVRPYIRESQAGPVQRWPLEITHDQLEHDRQIVLRGTSFVDGINVFGGAVSTSYHVHVVGWILPS
jgi:hypothetical protein